MKPKKPAVTKPSAEVSVKPATVKVTICDHVHTLAVEQAERLRDALNKALPKAADFGEILLRAYKNPLKDNPRQRPRDLPSRAYPYPWESPRPSFLHPQITC